MSLTSTAAEVLYLPDETALVSCESKCAGSPALIKNTPEKTRINILTRSVYEEFSDFTLMPINTSSLPLK